MRRLIQKYAPVIRFIFTFLGAYLLLALLYNLYLQNFDWGDYYPDFLTHLVAVQSEAVVSALNYNSEVTPGYPETNMHLMVNGKFVARIIEGCNAASIIILFVSFMLAFSGKLKTTFFFTLAGVVIIYVINILRIAFMAIGIYELPEYAHFLHSIAFPLVIYGVVFLLWVLWIIIYSKQIKYERSR
ncbi:exosortase family protein XrtF [Salinimicrobium sediminilitoris]|uniref:exosortase family protein XrtF n=1 Tax=Salinimicrobium sediminilitoris TaxID=2876715 RepID=UPI001E3D19C2|nr:exosortase family protein XrtF [Salinimicrobium sediminilitoris]MCC8360919.1 exosortase family protein XrtF [Salinimicrobium sediminilitoris]